MIYADAGPSERKSQRYTGEERQSMLMWVTRRMTGAEINLLKFSMVHADKEAAAGRKRPKPVWPNAYRMSNIFTGIPAVSFADDEEGLPPENSLAWDKLRRARMLAAKRAVEDFLQYQTVQPRASVEKGRFQIWREEKLVRMFKIIELGVVRDAAGVESAASEWPAETRPPMHRIFYDVWEAKLMSPRFAQDCAELAYNPNKPLSDRRIWELLKERNPRLYKGLITNKMDRDNELVRTSYARQHVLCTAKRPWSYAHSGIAAWRNAIAMRSAVADSHQPRTAQSQLPTRTCRWLTARRAWRATRRS